MWQKHPPHQGRALALQCCAPESWEQGTLKNALTAQRLPLRFTLLAHFERCQRAVTQLAATVPLRAFGGT